MIMDWIRGERLGHGSFAKVNLAVSRRNQSLMAVKSCGISHSSSLMKEKVILEELKDCCEIIQCYGDSVSCENGEKLYNLLLEYAAGGSLADNIKNCDDRRLPESEVRKYTKSLLKGLHYIHKFGYVHSDIKLQNILLFSDGGVKIADFGLAKRGGGKGCELRGTPMYMSPEMVSGGGEQGSPADIWALGCVVLEMVSGSPPWRCSDAAALLMKIGVGEEVPQIPGNLSEEGKDFLRGCFVKDPRERWTAEMLLNHPFVCGDQEDIDGQEKTMMASASPRCPLDWETCAFTSLSSEGYDEEEEEEEWSISAAERLRGLVCQHGPDWSVSDDWVTVR